MDVTTLIIDERIWIFASSFRALIWYDTVEQQPAFTFHRVGRLYSPICSANVADCTDAEAKDLEAVVDRAWQIVDLWDSVQDVDLVRRSFGIR